MIQNNVFNILLLQILLPLIVYNYSLCNECYWHSKEDISDRFLSATKDQMINSQGKPINMENDEETRKLSDKLDTSLIQNSGVKNSSQNKTMTMTQTINISIVDTFSKKWYYVISLLPTYICFWLAIAYPKVIGKIPLLYLLNWGNALIRPTAINITRIKTLKSTKIQIKIYLQFSKNWK